MDTAAVPLTGVYRPGYPFTAAELQTLTGRGVLRHMLADVYAEAVLPGSCAVRATAAAALLSRTLRTAGVLCGETAAWVHLGAAAPQCSSVITDGVYRRPTHGAWRIHQVPLSQAETEQVGMMQVTSLERTAADIYCGIGTADGRSALDQLLQNPELTDQLHYWPPAAEPLDDRDYLIWKPSAADDRRLEHRMHLIGELMHHARATPAKVLATVLNILTVSDHGHPRARQASSLLSQCASLRLPTVR